jgi:hypothetical protein
MSPERAQDGYQGISLDWTAETGPDEALIHSGRIRCGYVELGAVVAASIRWTGQPQKYCQVKRE